MPPVSSTSQPTPATPAASAPLLSIVIPTYQEAENLPVLVPQIAAVLERADIRAEILVVDDDSPDDTPAVCERLAADAPLRLIVRKGERGLSSAVIRGFQEARGDVLLCMDADLSHPPETIPSLLSAVAEDGADFVIGSRYVPGASTDEDWGAYRWLNSKVATLLARPLSSARDPMAGFFALRRDTFRSAAQLNPVGYKIGLELIVKCGCRDIREVPIHFRDRLHGKSKLGLREHWRYLLHVGRMYRFKLGRFLSRRSG
jgi:dolichol-phosphate mannosyltransferase